MRLLQGHRILLVDDNLAEQALMESVLRARGDSVRVASTIEEALLALADEEYCGLALDQELPIDDYGLGQGQAVITGGERVATETRKVERRRNEDGHHVTPIVAVTRASRETSFISKMFELGMDGFVDKTEPHFAEAVADKLRFLLERAGRRDHALCAALTRPVAKAIASGVVRLSIDGSVSGRRTGFWINGELRYMQNAKFVVFLRFAIAHRKHPGIWRERQDLGIRYSREMVSRIRAAFEGAIPAGFEILEGDGNGKFRLSPAVIVESIDWDVLSRHPDEEVRKIAATRGAAL